MIDRITRIAAVAVCAMFTVVQLHAGLSITPARSEVLLAPGASCEGKFSVRNDYSAPATIEVSFRDWIVLPENANIPVSGWLKIKPDEFSLKPGESKDVKYTVHMPPAAKGVSVAMISFTPNLETEQGVTLMMSVSLYVTAAGTEKSDWAVESINLSKTASEFRVSANVRNNGNVHVRPSGMVTVVTAGNDPVCAMNIAEGRPVYPGMTRPISAFYSNVAVLKEGSYKAIVAVNGANEQKTKTIDFIINKAGEVITQ